MKWRDPTLVVRQPLRGGRVLVGGVVVHDGVDLPPVGYQKDTLNSAFRLLAACCLAIRGFAKSDRLRVRG